MLINEDLMLEKLNSAKNVLLVEPPYPRKYPPLGLAKIKTYLEQRNIKSMYARNIIPFQFDLICVTSLFTYYSQDVFNVLKNRGLFNNNTPILVGGVFASLMPEQFEDKKNVFVFKGYSKVLDKCPAHIDIIKTVGKPWDTFSYVFTSRGCVNKCLEGNTIINTVEGDIPIKDLVGKEIGVYTYSPITKEVFITKAINIREMGVKKLVRVHFDDNTFIDCTPDHKFLTFKNGNQFSVLTEKETEAKDLVEGTSWVKAKNIKSNKYFWKLVFSIEYLEVPKMTYDMEVPETSWFFANNVLVHNCAYCSVWRIEKGLWVNDSWKDHIFMDRPNIMIFDNNLSSISFEQLKDITDFSLKHKKKLLFDNGFDCKHITKEVAMELGKIHFLPTGMRMAFDRIEEDGVFQKAVETLIESGVSHNAITAYVLFNFTDRPKDADYRARECVRLGIRPYPQYYRPLNVLNKETIFVGKHWTLQLGRAFRHYWLMRGLNSKMTFATYVKSKSGRHMHELTDNDIEFWDNNGVKGE